MQATDYLYSGHVRAVSVYAYKNSPAIFAEPKRSSTFNHGFVVIDSCNALIHSYAIEQTASRDDKVAVPFTLVLGCNCCRPKE